MKRYYNNGDVKATVNSWGLIGSCVVSRLKEGRERAEADWAEESESQRRVQSEMRARLEAALRDLDERTNQLGELREEAAQLRSARYKRDTEVSQLQAQLGQRDAELSTLQLEKQMVSEC